MRYWLRLLWCSQLCHYTLNLFPCYIFEVSIVTISCFQHSCSHESNQYLQFSYHISCHHFLVRTYNDMSSIIDSNEKWIMWWSPLEHVYWIFISWCFYIVFIFHQYCCYFISEVRILFFSRSTCLIIWWWLENSCLSRKLDKYHVFEEVVDFLIYKTWTCC